MDIYKAGHNIEAINRKRLALSAAAILGTVGLFLASRYEMIDKRDTMPSLVAVLDTNFWLATHVTSITIGYSAGLLAAALALAAIPLAFAGAPILSSYGLMFQGAFGSLFALDRLFHSARMRSRLSAAQVKSIFTRRGS